MDTTPSRDRLRQLILDRALKFGDFTLASGRKSTYYFNSKKVLFHSEAASLIGELLRGRTRDVEYTAVGGLEVGALPMAAAAAIAAHREGRALEGFFVRKAVKDHGTGESVEGQLAAGDRAVVVDDVLTTGGSAKKAVEAVEAAGATVAAVVCLVDRLAGAREALAGYDFRPLFTLEDFGIPVG